MYGSFNYLLTRQVVLVRYAHVLVPLPQNQASIRPVSRALAKGTPMILNRTNTIMTQWWITVIACSTFAARRASQPARTDSIDGIYNGSYAGGQDAPVRGQAANDGVRPITPIKFALSITQRDNGVLTGVFTLSPCRKSSDTKACCHVLTGYVQANRTFLLKRGQWEAPPPRGFEMAAGMNGLFDPNGGNGAGSSFGQDSGTGSWPKFEAIRDADESARMAGAVAAKEGGSAGSGSYRAASASASGP